MSAPRLLSTTQPMDAGWLSFAILQNPCVNTRGKWQTMVGAQLNQEETKIYKVFVVDAGARNRSEFTQLVAPQVM